jgi:hypothetical protein
MQFGGFAGMVRGMQAVAMRHVGVVRGLFVVTLAVMFGSFAVVCRSVLVMFRSFSMVIRSFVVVHRMILFPGEMGSRRQSGRTAIHQDFRHLPVTA